MQALALQQPWAVTEVSERSAFMAVQPAWDALVSAMGGSPFYRHDFFRIWLDNFAPTTRWRILLARDEQGQLQAFLPLIEERVSFYGLPVTQLSAAANPHSCRFDMVASDAKVAAQAFLSHLNADARWDVVRLIDVPERGNGFALYEAAKAQGLPAGTWESLRSPYLPLPATWEALQTQLTAKFKGNLRRRRKKLEEKGKVTFERCSGGELLDAHLEEGFILESSGWKGEQGTAIAQDLATRGFYQELARRSAYQGELSLYFLRLDGRAVAFHYGLAVESRYYLLKPGYDESLKECSPGQLLMEEVIRDCISRGIDEFDFLGPDMVWKRDWTDKVRAHTWLFMFRDSRMGRALCKAKFNWAPKAKELVTRWKK